MTGEHKIFVELKATNLDAYDFCETIHTLFHVIDDVVDEEKNPELLGNITLLCERAFSNRFYLAHAGYLRGLFVAVTNTYLDTLKMTPTHADVLRHCGIDVLLGVICLVFGYPKMREVSMELRDQCFKNNPTD